MRKTCAKPVDADTKNGGREHILYSAFHGRHNGTWYNPGFIHQNVHTEALRLSTSLLRILYLLTANLSPLSTGPIINTKRNICKLNTYYY